MTKWQADIMTVDEKSCARDANSCQKIPKFVNLTKVDMLQCLYVDIGRPSEIKTRLSGKKFPSGQIPPPLPQFGNAHVTKIFEDLFCVLRL